MAESHRTASAQVENSCAIINARVAAKMTTTLLLIRHGETDWNVEGRWQGHLDIPLNETGREQAKRLAHRLRGWPIRAVYSSDLQRAAATAAIIALPLQLQPVTDARWRERHGGAFQGLTRDEIRRDLPAAWQRLTRGIVEPPGGETRVALRARIVPAFRRMCSEHREEMVAVVSHGGALRILVAHVLGLPAGRRMPLTLRGNTGLTIVEVDDQDKATLVCLNDVAHLEGMNGEGLPL
jgi:probable phosphoglycerate mutase